MLLLEPASGTRRGNFEGDNKLYLARLDVGLTVESYTGPPDSDSIEVSSIEFVGVPTSKQAMDRMRTLIADHSGCRRRDKS